MQRGLLRGRTIPVRRLRKCGEHNLFISNINDISDYVESSNSTSGNILLTAKSVGTITVKFNDWNDVDSNGIASGAKAWYCSVTITADGFSGNALEYKLLGRWVYTSSSSNGTIVLNADKTGHITAYLNSSKIHDNDFTWSASESRNGSTTYQYLSINCTETSSLDGSHRITDVRTNRFTLNDYLAFGMPQQTTWNKQQ